MKILDKKYMLLMLSFLIYSSSCSSDEEQVIPDAPTEADAQFSYTFDTENPNKVFFSASPGVSTWYEHWNFGDNSAAEGTEAEKIFYLQGDYDVRFKVFGEGGNAETVQTISIAEDLLGADLVSNGTFEDDSGWTVLPISAGAEVSLDGGKASWTGGGWGHVGIYQSVEVEANTTYQVQMDISGSGMSDCWFEVYVGTTAPVEGQDYVSGGIILGLNTWDGCGNEAFDGPLALLSCSVGSSNGIFEYSEDVSAFLVIRSGGANLGAEGVSIDNVTIRAL